MRIAITGADDFLGWHTRCHAFTRADAAGAITTTPAGLADPVQLDVALAEVDVVIHCAGVDHGSAADMSAGNLDAAHALADGLGRVGRPLPVVLASPGASTVYDRAGEVLAAAAGSFTEVRLPELFGEHARPYQGSFVATFCHELGQGRKPVVDPDRELELLHAQSAAALLVRAATGRDAGAGPATGVRTTTVSQVLDILGDLDATYRHGDLPDLADPLRARLFSTYRSHLFPAAYPMLVTPHDDRRGRLVECVRTPAGGQAFISSTKPGAVRGEHCHLRKFERFLVVDGEVEIAVRRLFTDDVVRFRVRGEEPALVDMPAMWTYKLTNVGDRTATTFFWVNELYCAEDADTWPCPVDGRTPDGP
jgi:UDP-2-acetamido-2,6-beta-L-arabino-hexul-4-ose reductase